MPRTKGESVARRKRGSETRLGRRIKAELGARDWTQSDLVAAGTERGLTASTISRVVTGLVNPDVKTLDAIGAVLGIPVEELVSLALVDLSGVEPGVSYRGDEPARIAALVRSFPWLAPVVEDLSQFDSNDQAWIAAILEAQKRRRELQ
jgi:transcriptional regulator with XRE-family HTH domain